MSPQQQEKPLCFVISPIGAEGTTDRQRADNVLHHIIEPAALEFHVVRADQIAKPGHITTQIVEHILEAPLVVADLTGHNANVFYELALRHVTRKPVIHMSDGEWRPPFDVAPQRTIFFDVTDLGSAARARDELAQQIAAVKADPKNFDNPLSMSLDALTLRRSDNATDRVLSQLVSICTGLTTMVQTLDERTRVLPQSMTLGEINRLMHREPGPSLNEQMIRSALGPQPGGSSFTTDQSPRTPPIPSRLGKSKP